MSAKNSTPNFPIQKGTLQSSEGVTWNTADSLGRGATAVVYLGRQKRNGTVVAAKLFHEHIRLVAGGEEYREFELLQRLKHENIISLLSIEHELVSKRVVLIMQYCEGGSLYHMLDLPQYVYGLSKEEFLLVLKHVSAGMEYLRHHGIIHRDVKPGNIMRFITEDGRSIYKLTDFGAARELHEEENFTSLYGTEEYLHPGMYERAVLRLPTGQKFDAKVDLWSLGVTFYHVATGDLPFKPYGGRSNREKMFEIITQKASGVISGVQNFDKGPITWSYELPQTCPLPKGLKRQVVPVLAGLMECDDARVISYESLFHVVHRISNKVYLSVFHASSCVLLEVYLDKTDSFSAIQENVASITDLPANEQLLLLDGKLLEDIIDPSSEISTYPLYVLQSTIYLYQKDVKTMEKEKLVHPDIPRVPEFVNFIDVEKDLRLVHSCSARAHLIKRYTEETVNKQIHLVEAERSLRVYLRVRLKTTGERFLAMSQVLGEFKKRMDTFMSLLRIIHSLLSVIHFQAPVVEEVLKDKTLTAVHDKAEERSREIVAYRTALVERVDQEDARVKRWCARCKETDCVSKTGHFVTVITNIMSRFRRDKNVKDQMTSHDSTIHGFERGKLQTQCVAIASILQDHCYRNLDVMYHEYIQHFNVLSKNLNRVSKIEKNIDSVVDCMTLLSNKLDKMESKCQETFVKVEKYTASQSFQSPLQPTAPLASNPDLTTSPGIGGTPVDTGYEGSRSYDTRQGASNWPDKQESLVTTDFQSELRSLMQESRELVGLVEQNTEFIKKFEETSLQSGGSLSRNLSPKSSQN